MMAIGDITVTPVIDCVVRRAPTAAYATTSNEDWAPHTSLLDSDGMLCLTLGAYLIRSRDRLVLVDAGIGPDSRPIVSRGFAMPGGHLLDNLKALGVGVQDVTDVVFTHLHVDHIGWAALNGRPVFPNATYRCHRADWDYFTGAGSLLSAPEKLAPLTDRLVCWDATTTIAPGIEMVEAPGHTPGSSIVVLSSGVARGILLGDVVHCPVELVAEEWETIGDVDPKLARQTASRLASELEGTDIPVGAAHFPNLHFGRLLLAEGQRRWVFND
jgi:glyoxylase-like metal-dependent hydrolase (beta-lactamase superfamily II)